MADRLEFKDPHKRQPLAVTTVPASKLEVIRHQRKPRPKHVENIASSIERIGFVVPLVVVERNGSYVVIDGQHRFKAAEKLGLKELPVVVVPPELARRMMSLNVEKDLNIRERSGIALSLYQELAEETPQSAEDEAAVVDAIEHAHYVTLGLAYEKSARLAGSSFEPLLKRCDTFVDKPLEVAKDMRVGRAQKVLEASELTKTISEKIKEMGAWHTFVVQQILSYANPLKRTRKAVEFDTAFDKLIAKLRDLSEHPERVLKEPVGES